MVEGTKRKVVVVDDEPAIVDLVCDALSDVDVEAEGCECGPRVVSCIRSKQPELVVLDVQMPGIDGIEIFQRLRADPATSTVPVIFFTANAHKLRQRLPDFQQMNADLLPKPFDLGKLLDLVEQKLAA